MGVTLKLDIFCMKDTWHTHTLTKSAVTSASCVCDPGSHTALMIKLPVSSWGWRARWSTTEPELLNVNTWQSFKPHTARKSSLQELPVMDRTVNGTWAVARRVRVSFLLLESACFRSADSWRTVIWEDNFKQMNTCKGNYNTWGQCYCYYVTFWIYGFLPIN